MRPPYQAVTRVQRADNFRGARQQRDDSHTARFFSSLSQIPFEDLEWYPHPQIMKKLDTAISVLLGRRDPQLLTGEHCQLRAAVEDLAPSRLSSVVRKQFTCAALIRGIAAHDLYHAGQIQLLKRLATTVD